MLTITSLPDDQYDQLAKLLCVFQYIFRTHIRLNTLYTCHFNVPDDKLFKIRPYPVPFARHPAVDQELQRMID